MSGRHFSLGITAPEQINTTRTGDGTPSVMIKDKTAQGLPASDFSLGVQEGFLGLDKRQSSGRKQSCISSNRATRLQDQRQTPLGPMVHLAKKYVTRIGLHDAHTVIGMCLQVAADTLERQVSGSEASLVKQQATDALRAQRVPQAQKNVVGEFYNNLADPNRDKKK